MGTKREHQQTRQQEGPEERGQLKKTEKNREGRRLLVSTFLNFLFLSIGPNNFGQHMRFFLLIT